MVNKILIIKRKIVNRILRDLSTKTQMDRITNIFDYNLIIRDRRDPDKRVLLSNRYYGMNHILKRYANYYGCINSAIEHGPNLDCEEGGEYLDKTAPALLVQSNQRKQFLREKKLGKPIISIGTSIFYGRSIFNDYDLKVVKEYLGKTLLIYPLHDIEDYHYIQDTEAFIDYVRDIKEKHGYKTVLVSMYFVDIERGRHLRFEQEGWKIVSSGRRENYDFCDIMKTVISIADFAIFQAYTSAIGFCTYLGVPSMIYHQPFLFTENGRDDLQTDMGVKDATMKKFEEVFSDYNEEVTQEKWDFCNYWFGFDNVLEPDQLNLIFQYLSELKVGMTKQQMYKKAKKDIYQKITKILIEAIDAV